MGMLPSRYMTRLFYSQALAPGDRKELRPTRVDIYRGKQLEEVSADELSIFRGDVLTVINPGECFIERVEQPKVVSYDMVQVPALSASVQAKLYAKDSLGNLVRFQGCAPPDFVVFTIHNPPTAEAVDFGIYLFGLCILKKDHLTV